MTQRAVGGASFNTLDVKVQLTGLVSVEVFFKRFNTLDVKVQHSVSKQVGERYLVSIH